MAIGNENEIAKLEHDQAFHVKKVSPFLSDGAGNLVRQKADAQGNVSVSSAVYQVLLDETTTTNALYIGKAVPGTATSAATWQIAKYDTSSSPNSLKWADSGNFSQVWNNRASLTYA